jgi:peroxiredoxin
MNAKSFLLAVFVMSAPAFATAPGERVANFKLQDQAGQPHELYALSERKAVVLMIQGNGCPIVRQALPALREIRDRYQARGVEFLLLNPNLQDTRESVASESQEFGIQLPILVDSTQQVGEALGVQRTAEVFVIDPKSWKVAYRGPMDDRLSYEKQRPTASKHYLADALDAMLAGRQVKVTHADGVGCIVNFPERAAEFGPRQTKDLQAQWP